MSIVTSPADAFGSVLGPRAGVKHPVIDLAADSALLAAASEFLAPVLPELPLVPTARWANATYAYDPQSMRRIIRRRNGAERLYLTAGVADRHSRRHGQLAFIVFGTTVDSAGQPDIWMTFDSSELHRAVNWFRDSTRRLWGHGYPMLTEDDVRDHVIALVRAVRS